MQNKLVQPPEEDKTLSALAEEKESLILSLGSLNWTCLWDLMQCLAHWQDSVEVSSSVSFLRGEKSEEPGKQEFSGKPCFLKPLAEHSRCPIKVLASGADKPQLVIFGLLFQVWSCRGSPCWGILEGSWVLTFWGLLLCQI